MNKTGKFLGIILMLLLGILLLSFAFQPPKVFTFSYSEIFLNKLSKRQLLIILYFL